MKKVKQITVSPSTEYILWTEDTSSIVYNTKVIVETGSKAVYYVNGEMDCEFAPGVHEINNKKERRENQSLKLIGYNKDKRFRVLFGASGIKYRDYEINEETDVGIHGFCAARIDKAAQLYKALGKDFVTENDVSVYTREKTSLQSNLITALAEMLRRHNYNTIDAKMTELNKIICEQFSNILSDIGIILEDVKVEEIYFPEEFKQKRADYFAQEKQNKILDEEFRRKKKEQKAEVDIITTLINATGNGGGNSDKIYCPRCNKENKANDKFCTNCGLSLNSKQ